MTVPSIPMASDVERSMPAISPVAPRQMFPPPTTIANSRSSSSLVSAISRQSRSTVAASIVWSDAVEASASPDIFSTSLFLTPMTVSLSRR